MVAILENTKTGESIVSQYFHLYSPLDRWSKEWGKKTMYVGDILVVGSVRKFISDLIYVNIDYVNDCSIIFFIGWNKSYKLSVYEARTIEEEVVIIKNHLDDPSYKLMPHTNS